MKFIFRRWSYLLAFSILPSLLVWTPFFFRFENFLGVPIPEDGMQTVISNFDGPLYIVVAKSFYNLEHIAANFSFDLPLEYYAAHFPLYPIAIKLFGSVLGYPWGMMLATQFGVILASYFFFKLARKNLDENQALWLTFLFSFFPARWLIVKSVGSPEPMFLASIMASIYYFSERKYWKAGFWGTLAQLTKSPGILLFLAYGLFIVFEKLKDLTSIKQSVRKWFHKLNIKAYPVILIPISLGILFIIYGQPYTFGDYLAYFNSGDNIHLFFPPFQIFNYSQPWVQTHWLEEIIFVYMFALLGLVKLIREKKYLHAWFVGVFFTTIIFVSHRDILRYSLPILPFLILGFEKELQKPEIKFIFLFLILPIYMFTLAFIANNAMPISNWTPFL